MNVDVLNCELICIDGPCYRKLTPINRFSPSQNVETADRRPEAVNDVGADGDSIRRKFKDFINRLACVKEENGTKFLILRNEYLEELHNSRHDLSLPSYPSIEETDNCSGLMSQDQPREYSSPPPGHTAQQPQWRHYSPDCPRAASEYPPRSPIGVSRIHSSPCLLVDDNCYEDVPPPLPQKKHSIGGSPKRPDMPLPPPRGRKNHGRRGSQVEERVRQFSVEKELES
ncbi:hypothetical protein HPB51_020464 [Rhipicephalus microplus]|uniref:SOWAHA-C winged helix-turn-helix domain-containing protein n=1 Tax=Rhipicephalus microplus TaxID=6941 RepID=A0A9J6DBY9_RHIMP|nr:hypothetical protein HPB51_020464 [Rhipicephalus microplus]